MHTTPSAGVMQGVLIGRSVKLGTSASQGGAYRFRDACEPLSALLEIGIQLLGRQRWVAEILEG